MKATNHNNTGITMKGVSTPPITAHAEMASALRWLRMQAIMIGVKMNKPHMQSISNIKTPSIITAPVARIELGGLDAPRAHHHQPMRR